MEERRRKKSYIVFFICIILFIFLANIFSKNIRNSFYHISNPIQEKLWGAGLNVSNFIGGFAINKSEIDSLKQQNTELQTQLISLKETQDENNSLKEALGLELNKKYKLILGKFTSKDVNGDSVIINKGLNDGVQAGMPIITSGGIVAGKISEVYGTYSKADLISNKNVSFDVRIAHGEKNISAVAKGQGNLRISLTLIPQEEQVSQEDMIVTDSLGGVFPQLLGVGKIKSIRKSDTSPFQEAEIEPFFNITQAREIFIVSGNL